MLPSVQVPDDIGPEYIDEVVFEPVKSSGFIKYSNSTRSFTIDPGSPFEYIGTFTITVKIIAINETFSLTEANAACSGDSPLFMKKAQYSFELKVTGNLPELIWPDENLVLGCEKKYSHELKMTGEGSQISLGKAEAFMKEEEGKIVLTR